MKYLINDSDRENFSFSLLNRTKTTKIAKLRKMGAHGCGWLPNGRLAWRIGRSFGQTCIIHFFFSVPDEYWRSLSFSVFLRHRHTHSNHSHTHQYTNTGCVQKYWGRSNPYRSRILMISKVFPQFCRTILPPVWHTLRWHLTIIIPRFCLIWGSLIPIREGRMRRTWGRLEFPDGWKRNSGF